MSEQECDNFWEDAYLDYRAAGYSVEAATELADEDLSDWLEGFVC